MNDQEHPRAQSRISLRVPDEAAEAFGVSADHFNRHIRDELKLIRCGRVVLVSVRELERWAESNAEPPLTSVPVEKREP